MGAGDPGASRPAAVPDRLLGLVRGLAYAAVVAAAATVAAVVLGVVTGGGLVRAKYVLFFVGFGLMAVATATLWPSSPEDLEDDPSIPEEPGASGVERVVEAVPPASWLPAPRPGARLSRGSKLFLASLATLAVSYAMEAVFGIAATS